MWRIRVFWVVWMAAALPLEAVDPDRRLVDAVENRALGEVNRLLSTEVDIDASQQDGMTALHWACYHDDFDLVQLMVMKGAAVNVANRFGVTPLSLACTNGNPRIVELLLQHGAAVDQALPGGETPLMTASRTGVPRTVAVLIKAEADIGAADRRGQNALMWAAAEGHTEVVRQLLAAGADHRTSVASGFDALMFATRAGREDVVETLLAAGADLNRAIETNRGGKAPRKGTSPLILAVENGHFQLAMRLVRAGADPNDERSGFAPLHMLSWVRKPNRGDGDDGDPAPAGSGQLDSLQFAAELVKAGADVNLRLKHGGGGQGKLARAGATPFMLASVTADLPLMKLLVQCGADPAIPNSQAATPLMAAAGLGTLAPGEEAGTEEEVLECLKYLLDLGCDVNTIDENGESAMHGAAYKNLPRVVAFLADHGHRVDVWNRANRYGWTPLSIAQGIRVGNFKPSPDTEAALRLILEREGVPPAEGPRAKPLDPYRNAKGKN